MKIIEIINSIKFLQEEIDELLDKRSQIKLSEDEEKRLRSLRTQLKEYQQKFNDLLGRN